MSRRFVTLAAAAGIVEVAGAALVILTSHREPHKVATAALAVTAGASFIASGLQVIRLRPGNRTGLYLAAVGYLWLLAALRDGNSDAVWTVGVALGNLAFVPFAGLVLSFPSGRLKERIDRVLMWVTVGVVGVTPVLLLFAKRPPSCDSHCGESVIFVSRQPALEQVVEGAQTVAVVLLLIAAVTVLARRWRRASVALRRVLRPVYGAGAAALLILLLNNIFATFSTRVANMLAPVFFVLFGAVPFAFGYGILRARLARGSVADLVLTLEGGGQLRDAIAAALGDPSLELAYWIEDGGHYVDRDGRPVDVPASATVVEREGRRVGALVHDPSLHEEPDLVQSVGAAVALALDNERLQAELRTQYEFLTTIVDTTPSLLVTVDGDGRIRNLNPATVQASGYDDEEQVRGRFFWDVFIDEGEREAMVERFHAAAPEHPPAEYENVFTNARGEWRVIAWRTAPVHDDSGAVVRIVAGGLDVTERALHEEELRASRTRLVAAGDEARRRLERNLHDGAQQRLVSLSVALRLAQGRLEADPAGARAILTGASDELRLALEELRELARGIHPAVLTDRGLAAALRSLADRTPLPVELDAPGERLPEPVEAAAYYVVSEAIANVVKHARASAIDVSVAVPDGRVVVTVADDGVGGADPGSGSGLRGLLDRVAVLDGELRLESPPGGGTRVVAEIPL